jgi:hypothetical protein
MTQTQQNRSATQHWYKKAMEQFWAIQAGVEPGVRIIVLAVMN